MSSKNPEMHGAKVVTPLTFMPQDPQKSHTGPGCDRESQIQASLTPDEMCSNTTERSWSKS